MKNLFQPQNSSEKLLFQAHIHFTTVFFTRKKTKFRRFKGCDLMLNISVISQKKTRKTIHKHLLKFFSHIFDLLICLTEHYELIYYVES